ncbi:MAG TPA: NmrA family NAD(P)-binding protein, partial [Rubellimicrobium sp.]|nr:NmrA family NAD(P)-binding protein [Rubellimicrobium sp.]
MSIIAIAGATGDLGGRIATALRDGGAEVRALVRAQSDAQATVKLREQGCKVVEVDLGDVAAHAEALRGADVVISALSGVRDVIVEAQGRLLDAAVAAGVPRFIPSDFAVDFRGHRPGTNRNLDLRREFMARLDAAPIRATSILCGMFTDLLKGTAPMVIAPIRRVVYWGTPTSASTSPPSPTRRPSRPGPPSIPRRHVGCGSPGNRQPPEASRDPPRRPGAGRSGCCAPA